MDKHTRYRRRLEAKGCKQIAVWLDAEAVTALQRLEADAQADRNVVISAVLKQAAARLSEGNLED
jgi:hypothetical protein